MSGIESCRIRTGRSPVLFVAPHGGRRSKAHFDGPFQPGVKINDLHTGALAFELGERFGASVIANESLDRNEVDLNRISQVRDRAPWFAELVERELARILREHPSATVVFVHGWNAMQPGCDVGIGARLADSSAAAAADGELTVTVETATGLLERFAHLGEASGFEVGFGDRYPGRHANNVLQWFRRGGTSIAPGALGTWVGEGRIEAFQLELTVPLRWPGPWRSRFVDALEAAFFAPSEGHSAPVRRRGANPLAKGGGVRGIDLERGLGVLGGIAPGPTGRWFGRLLLLTGGARSILFTGEAPTASDSIGPLRVSRDGESLLLEFDGPALFVPDGRRYRRTELALQGGELARVGLELRYDPACEAWGTLEGDVRVDGANGSFRAVGFPDRELWRRKSGLAIHGALGREVALFGVVDEEGFADLTVATRSSNQRIAGLVKTSSSSEVAIDAGELGRFQCGLENVMEIVRPVAPRRFARVDLGRARIRLGANGKGCGLYERVAASATGV